MAKKKESVWKVGFGCVVFVLFPICLMQCGLVVHAILDPLDFLALQSIRKGLEDMPGSNFFASWDFTSEPCDFAGVYCEADKVIALTLGDPRASSPGLTGRIDPAIGRLSSLAELSVVPGRIFGSLPQSLSKLKNLRFLAVSQNFITGTIPANLGNVRTLKTLDLSYNLLTGGIPASIGTIPELSNLMLCHNRLTGRVPMFFSPTITRLDLKHNNLSGSIEPGTLPVSLQFISLSWNRLSGSVDWLLSRVDRLNYLDLSFNQFSGSIPSQVFTLSITHLQLQRNRFSGAVQPVEQVTIPTVDLSYNRLSGSISPMFSTVQNLYLNNNRFTGQVPGSFVDRLLTANIQILYLQHNYLTEFEINPLAEIPLSSSLCLQYNCMVPPIATPCPLTAGTQKTRPTDQCIEWRG